MVFVSKEPELFGGKVKLSILIDGDEFHFERCEPEKADKTAIKAIETLILGMARYLLKQAPNVRHTEIIQLRQSINSSKAPYKVIGANLEVIRKHLPKGRLKNACHHKLHQVEKLIEYRRAMEKTTEP